MANLNVTYQDLESVRTRLESGQSDIEGKLTELKNAVDELVSAGFQTDQASGAFQTSYEEFNHGATETIGGLEGMRMFLQKAAEAFEQLDSELSSAISG